ncbi:MAG: mandelate racemase/muconate lactonizing enzyme family protein [Verrucomicrobiota bacterium]
MKSDLTRNNRRHFIKYGACLSAGIALLNAGCAQQEDFAAFTRRLIDASNKPVLRKDLFTSSVTIESIDLLRRDNQFFVHVRSTDGAEGLAMTNRTLINSVYPLLLNRVAPIFIGKDARDLEALLNDVFVSKLNYKWQGAPFWMCVAWVEFAILDLLGKTIGQPVGVLLGNRLRDETSIYYANGDRSSSAENVVDQLKGLIQKSGAQAVKFKLGARMRFDDASTARDIALIPLARKELGDETILYTDANSSFDVPTAIRIGKLLEANNYSFFEEPVQFDYLEETKAVAEALNIPIAGGEQESSMRRFRWLIENDAVQIPQPELLFFGGLIRCIRVARMAEVAGKKVVPHMSGFGLGILYVLHYASVVPNSNEFQEYKGDKDGIPYEVVGTGRPLESIKGVIQIPKGPGLGVAFDPSYMSSAQRVQL